MASLRHGSEDHGQQGHHEHHEHHEHQDKNANKTFDINVVCDAFDKCIRDKNSIGLDHYLIGFQELLKFFNLLGTVFKFVASDVESKITILDNFKKDSEHGTNYQTIQMMIQYEKSQNLLKDPKHTSGSRTLLRLHRALEFVSHFMFQVSKLDDHHGTSSVARECYKKTLAKYHPWFIQKSALLAMYTLPHRRQLVEKAFGVESATSSSNNSSGIPSSHGATESMAKLSAITDAVYQATHKLYDEHDLLSLP